MSLLNDIFNTDNSGGTLPDWAQTVEQIYGDVTGTGQQGPKPAPVQGPPVSSIASFGGTGVLVIVALVVAALAFGVKGRG